VTFEEKAGQKTLGCPARSLSLGRQLSTWSLPPGAQPGNARSSSTGTEPASRWPRVSPRDGARAIAQVQRQSSQPYQGRSKSNTLGPRRVAKPEAPRPAPATFTPVSDNTSPPCRSSRPRPHVRLDPYGARSSFRAGRCPRPFAGEPLLLALLASTRASAAVSHRAERAAIAIAAYAVFYVCDAVLVPRRR